MFFRSCILSSVFLIITFVSNTSITCLIATKAATVVSVADVTKFYFVMSSELTVSEVPTAIIADSITKKVQPVHFFNLP